jgi:hypothetical protein
MYFLFTSWEYVIFFQSVQKFSFFGFSYYCHCFLYAFICMSCI